MKTKIAKNFIYTGLGFPIMIESVELVHVRGEWLPKIDVLDFELYMAKELSESTFKLTGNQVKFLRSFLNMSLRELAQYFALTHVAIKKWEDHGDEETKMSSACEMFLKILVRDKLRRDEGTKRDPTEVYLNKLLSSIEEKEDQTEEKIIRYAVM